MANTQVTGDLIADGAITAAKLSNVTTDTISEGTALYYTDARVASYLSANSYATEGYVTTAVNNLIDAAPASLDTLNELAAALNDDANFATTVTNALATKLNLSGGNITGNLSVDTDVLFVDTVNDRVGIGATTPSSKLEIITQNTNSDGISITADGSSFGYASNIYLKSKLEVGGSIVTQGKITSQAESVNNSFVSFSTVGSGTLTEAMRITSTGNVGIGTSSPANKLHILGTGGVTLFSVENTESNRYSELSLKTADEAFYIFKASSGYTSYGGANAVNYYNEAGDHSFHSDSTSNILTIKRGGNVGIGTSSPAVKLHVAGGNIKLDNGYGIDFSASAGGGATSSLLDDYEEGTFTPSYASQTGTFGSITYDASRLGMYTKIGNIVHITGVIRTDSITVGTASGNVLLSGLPFTTNSGVGGSGVLSISNVDDFAGQGPISGVTIGSSTTAFLYYRDAVDGNEFPLQVSDLATGSNDNNIRFSVTYRTT